MHRAALGMHRANREDAPHQATVVGTSPSYDLAVLKIQGVSGLTPASLGKSADLQVGQQVVAIALGTAVALTLWPLLWAARRGVPGSLVAAGRRGGLAGLVVAILVVLRALDVVSLPVVLFLIIGAILVEVAFSLRH